MYLPGVAQGNDVVDVDVAGGGPGGAVELGVPGAGGSGAVGACDDVPSVTLQDRLAGVARSNFLISMGFRCLGRMGGCVPADGDPVGEQIPRVPGLGTLSGDRQASKQRLRGSSAGNVRCGPRLQVHVGRQSRRHDRRGQSADKEELHLEGRDRCGRMPGYGEEGEVIRSVYQKSLELRSSPRYLYF